MSVKKNKSTPYSLAYFGLIEISQLLEARIKLRLQEYDLTHGQYNILKILKGSKGIPLTSKMIKERMIVSFPDVTRLVDRLVKKGFVNKEKNQENRREVDIYLVDKGELILKELDPIMKMTAYNFFEDHISSEEANLLNVLLTKIRIGMN